MKFKIFKKLKPKTASLGFTREERESIAAEIADNLETNEDATDEEIDAAIDKAIDAALPMLKVAQSIKNRAINESKKTGEHKETSDDDDASTKEGSKKKSQSQGDDDEAPAWFKKYQEDQDKRVAALEQREVKTTRKSKLEEALKGVKDTFKSRTLKDYTRMNFNSEEEFEEYLEDVKTDAEAFVQEESNDGLAGSHKPGAGGKNPKDDKPNAIVSERIKEREAETGAPAIIGLPQN